MRRSPRGRLELTWTGKDQAPIPYEDGKYDYAWVDPQLQTQLREAKAATVMLERVIAVQALEAQQHGRPAAPPGSSPRRPVP